MLTFVFAFALATSLAEPAELQSPTANEIADQAFNHGEVVQTAEYLADHIGPRLTNSPNMRRAENWTLEQLRRWGLKDVRKEPFLFGRGWWVESCTARMISPRLSTLQALPLPWTPATQGAVTAEVIVAPMERQTDFERWRGKLKGKLVLVTLPGALRSEGEAPPERFSDEDLRKLDAYQAPVTDAARAAWRIKHFAKFETDLDRFLAEEGALAWARLSERDGRLVHGDSDSQGFRTDKPMLLPALEIAAEDYRRLARLARTGQVLVSFDSRVHFDDADLKANNVLADIPGADANAGYVMAGAHLDSWYAGDGAADNGAGVAIVLEAARILSALKVRPKRTIRFALWAGEEQGLLGSFAYVDRYLAKRPKAKDPSDAGLGPYWTGETFPIVLLPGYRDLTAYFNVDMGSGKIRGIYAENNLAAAPILRDWLSPFSGMGATTVAMRRIGGTDHLPMARIGLPAFQFIQDPLDYELRVHHSDVDTFDHLRPDDLRQASTVVAGLLLEAANSSTRLLPNVVPTKPNETDPFAYENPDRQR